MGAAYSLHTRRQGAGSVTYRNGRWEARGPIVKGEPGVYLGRHDFRKQAEAAIAQWLAANRKESAA